MATPGSLASETTATTNATRTAGAFVASAALHVLILAAIGAVLVAHGAPSPWRPPITVALVSPLVEPSPVVPVPRAAAKPATAEAPKLAAPPDASAVRPEVSRYVLPWAQAPRLPETPAWMFDRPMVGDGVTMLETRNLVALGEEIERKIQSDFGDEPALPILLRSPDELGYPLEAIESGVEGRVVIWMGVDEEGKVVDATILDGPPVLAEWVASRAGRLIEKPARNAKGDGMRGWVALEIDFTREPAAQAAVARDLASPSVP